ncbi:MAG: helix-turn-helix transcriptional regulator [Acidimicrobiales bacterium]|nr:helix-turn-helix transcriptional regulator [Acidimicrobiales bacterium]
MTRTGRVRVAAVNDYHLVVAGVAALLSKFSDRLVVVDQLIVGEPLDGPVDVALYDTYGREGVAAPTLRALADTPEISHVAVFSLDLHPDLIAAGRAAGAHGFISKGLSGAEITDAIVRVADGELVVASTPSPRPTLGDLLWPGKSDGLTERESQVLILAAEGLSNREIGAALYLSPETVKGYVSQVLTKLELRNRVEAARWAHRNTTFVRLGHLGEADLEAAGS